MVNILFIKYTSEKNLIIQNKGILSTMNNYKILLAIFLHIVIIMFYISFVYSDSLIEIYPAKQTVLVKPQSKGYAVLQIQLPKKGYIYANPKGEGTGKATVAIAKASHPIVPGNTRYLPGTFYISPLDNKPVYIYKKQTSVCIPFQVNTTQEGTYSLSITVEALLCDDVSCTPVQKTITQTIRVDAKAPEFNKMVYDVFKEPKEITPTVNADSTSGDFTVIDVGSATPMNLLYGIIFGIIAGFLLNFMPCVLPVISLKLFSFVSYSNNDHSKIRIMGSLFTAGILTSFLVLSSLAAFAGYNWGELFQHHTFVIVMSSIIFALGLSFFGVYTFTIPYVPQLQSANVYLDSYFKGIIATLLATPCSGPFLGATLAWSLTQHPVIIFIIFINIGLGMSLPYLLLSFYPSLIRFIPKPGDWMITFEQIMGFLLIATSIYLLTLLDSGSLVKALWFLLLLSIAFWQWGRFGNITKQLMQRIVSFIVLILLIVGSATTLFTLQKNTSTDEISYTQFDWEAIASRKNSQIAMVVFTADWCPNCKFVEATALASQEVITFIQANSIQVYKADITTKNQQAENILQRLGSRSIPFVAIFPKGDNFSRPIILRDIYTAKDVLNALQKAIELSTQSELPQLLSIP